MMSEVSTRLREIDVSCVEFILQFEDDFQFSLSALLQLRRELRNCAAQLDAECGRPGYFRRILEPAGFADPVARRKFRSPSPGFVFRVPERLPGFVRAGDEVALPVALLGSARRQIGDLGRLFQLLGRGGLSCGTGVFTLLELRQSPPGREQVIWNDGDPLDDLPLAYQDLAWWVDRGNSGGALRLSISTPARLLRHGKPLFATDFKTLFPFALRRVTSMLYAWGECEVLDDVQPLLQRSAALTVIENTLRWSDWRTLEGEGSRQDLGGLVGDIVVGGEGLEEICWVLRLLELFNLGKGAAYAAGCCRLTQVA